MYFIEFHSITSAQREPSVMSLGYTLLCSEMGLHPSASLSHMCFQNKFENGFSLPGFSSK